MTTHVTFPVDQAKLSDLIETRPAYRTSDKDEIFDELSKALPILMNGGSHVFRTSSRSYRATLASPDTARMAGGIQNGDHQAIAFGIFIYRINNKYIHLIWL